MSRRILIIDAIPTRRIVMRVKLGAAQYDVVLAADLSEAQDHLATQSFDIIFVDAALQDASGAVTAFCAGLKASPATQSTPLILMTDGAPEEDILAAFEAGYDEVMIRPLSERVLLAQLRALLRRETGSVDSRETSILGDIPGLPMPPRSAIRLAVVASSRARARSCAAGLKPQCFSGAQPSIIVEDHAGIITAMRDEPELDAVLLLADPGQEEAALNLLSDLRSRGAASRAGLILSLDLTQSAYGARAFDLGADNVVSQDMGPSELALRVSRLAGIKHRRDALRRKVRDGLRMAVTDPLTGVYNRRFATEKLAQIASGTDAFSVLMLDLDHFKQINDLYGHCVGDDVLATIAKVLKSNLRDSDLLARIGGEEFLIALPGASPAQAVATAERLRAIIDRTHVRAKKTGAVVKATLSIGVVHSDGTVTNTDALIAKADEALYRAKSDGRNMVSVSQAA